VGNQVEKTNLVTIKPVQNEKIPPVNNPVMSANTLTKKSDSTPAMHHSSTSTPLTPPQPVRMRRQTKSDRRMENKSLPKEDTEYQPKRENIQETDKNDADKNDADKNDADKNDTDKNDADKNNADKNNADKNNTDKNEADKSDTAIPVPILVSPDGKVAEIFEPIRERQPVYPNRSDKMTEELLTTMGVFFEDGLPIEVTKTIPKISAVEKSVAGQSDIPQPVVSESVIRHPMVSQTSVTQTEAKLPVAGSITGISLNTTAAQPQIIVKWNVGDAPWQESQIDILRGSTMNGPWQPIAINLRNNGEYWWFLTSLDLNPFFVMVRIRSFQSGVASDVTDTPIEINPALLKQSSSR
ncbi:MAG: hypothetical protein LBG58_14790, partial [Planctomycetaceae bacterium]|nr:hypothetical protein [Planctomycetaceae bacterium]